MGACAVMSLLRPAEAEAGSAVWGVVFLVGCLGFLLMWGSALPAITRIVGSLFTLRRALEVTTIGVLHTRWAPIKAAEVLGVPRAIGVGLSIAFPASFLAFILSMPLAQLLA